MELSTLNLRQKDVNFEGESVTELIEAFHEAADDYIAYCKEEGLPLHKSYSGNLNIESRYPPTSELSRVTL